MKNWLKLTIWIAGILILLLFLAMLWYNKTYSMDEAQPFTVNDSTFNHHVLIATQGSEFKDSLVVNVVNAIKSRPVYIQVIDVSKLEDVNETQWEAIVVIHTWENWKPQKDANIFANRINDKEKLIMVSTSGSGFYHVKGIDAITSVSQLSEASPKAHEIVARIEKLLYKSHTKKY